MSRARWIGAGFLGVLCACIASSDARRTILSARAPAPIGPYSQAVQVGDTLYAAGQIGLEAQSGAHFMKLSEDELTTVKKWIDAGAVEK